MVTVGGDSVDHIHVGRLGVVEDAVDLLFKHGADGVLLGLVVDESGLATG